MIYVFDEYELDTRLYELHHAGALVQLEPKVFDLLAYLVEHGDRIVPKPALFAHLWPSQFISDATLPGTILMSDTTARLVQDEVHLEVLESAYVKGKAKPIAVYTVLDMLRHHCDIAETDSPEAVVEKVRQRLHEVGLASDEDMAYLLQFLGVQEDTPPVHHPTRAGLCATYCTICLALRVGMRRASRTAGG